MNPPTSIAGPSVGSESNAPDDSMTADHPSATPGMSAIDALPDAREIVRTLQCPICSYPLTAATTLPCGNVLCRGCIPQKYRRPVTYPNIPARREGFLCPFGDCQKEHTAADSALDVTLSKIITVVEEHLMAVVQAQDDPPAQNGKTASRLATVYGDIKAGRVPYDAELDLKDASDDGIDRAVLQSIKSAATPEFECLVCYGLIFDPITTRCGHTYCRRCLHQVLGHSQACPSCRQSLQLPSVLSSQSSNKRLTEMLAAWFTDELAERADAIAKEENENTGPLEDDLDTSVFVCAPSFPSMPTPLYIFEPKYRLMIRRAWEGSRTFGMVLENRRQVPQGELGLVPFMRYGTMLQIQQMHMNPDGSSYIWTTGTSKFRIMAWGYRDEYLVARTESVPDIPHAEEEAFEIAQTTGAPAVHLPPWASLSTAELFEICINFAQDVAENIPAPRDPRLMHPLELFGQPPNDPVLIPYWLAAILPVAEDEKYRIIRGRSVRQRLLITASWAKHLKDIQWFESIQTDMTMTNEGPVVGVHD